MTNNTIEEMPNTKYEYMAIHNMKN